MTAGAALVIFGPVARSMFSVELCAGGGGAALGLEGAGFSPVLLLDNNPHACATLRLNRPGWNVTQADIQDFEFRPWSGVDLLSCGLPCPPFSIAGKQLGEHDERNLFPAMLQAAKELEPRAVLVENVRGILMPRFDDFRQKVKGALDGLGFDADWTWFNAADFGVPQNRPRAFLLALRRGAARPVRWPLAMQRLAPSVGGAIGDLMAERGWLGAKAWKRQASGLAPALVGGSLKHGGPDLGPTRARSEWARLGVDGLGLADEAPAPKFSGMPRLTLRMAARLQSFPDDWAFSGSKTPAYRQVGNALPVSLALAVGIAVHECLAYA